MTFASPSQSAGDRSPERFRELMAQVRAGSEDAAWQLVEHFGRTIVRTVRSMLDFPLRVRFDSRDFTQAVWLSFFEHRSQIVDFEHPEQLVKFLAKAACHKVVDEFRKMQTAKRRSDRDRAINAPPVLAAHDPTPSQFALARERWDGMLAGQPRHHQEVIRLRFLGHTQTDIAETLQIDERTVRKILGQLEE